MTKILSDSNFVKIYLTSGESFILNELDGEAEGVNFGSRDASGRKARYAVTVAKIVAVREHW